MNKKQLTAFALGLGFTKAMAAKIAENADEKAADIEQSELDKMREDFRTSQADVYRNDPEFLKDIESAVEGKERNIMTRAVKSVFGLEAAEIKDKKFEEVLTIAKEKSSKGATKETKELQDEIIKLTNENKQFKEVTIPELEAKSTAFEKNFLRDSKQKDHLGKLKLRVPVGPVFSSLQSELSREGYELSLNDKDEFVLTSKATKTQPLKKDKSGTLSYEDWASEKLTEWNFVEKSKADTKKPGQTTQPDELDDKTKKVDNPTTYAPHLRDAVKHLNEIKKQSQSTE